MMTETTQHHDAATEIGMQHAGDTRDPSITHSSSPHPATDSASDNDTSERPVREKLKKTSIASIPKSGTNPPRNGVAIQPTPGVAPQNPEKGSLGGQEAVKAEPEPRGRPLRKRSFDDLEAEEDTAGDRTVADQSGHSRKRSRDVRVGEDIKGDERVPGTGQVSVQEEDEDEAGMVDKDLRESRGWETEEIAKNLPPSSHQDDADQEMRDSAFSPRKKRSRDQFDTEGYREQKIPATEEAKAHRRSEENEREETLLDSNNGERANGESVEDERKKFINQDSKKLNVSLSILAVIRYLVAHVAEGTIYN